ncbi:Formyl-CoA transferase (plasmid) [Pseudonocardia dioxanivorans CB1190]|uniref:Formyl-CoA transferase n=1 Tax=Pseudonocardia dioxanivorans (strain ATCC 55486 / DSM 44775 / JCM 13855 / CB1190) TaxID=675635 RepID=F2L6H0_PSEUX|nr:CoA transferase [Pseudonocardia dioxanivorans]AEA28864.1 Formyl-CoA transferase [Pseudonocardia dioxanivorans CB1190]
MGSLEGVRVLDLSRILAGPYLTMLLGDLGADVIKLERPEGDDTRSWGPPFVNGEATYFWSANRNKRSVVLDLRDDSDLAAALELAATADVVVENFRPGVAERLGLGYSQVQRHNPGVVYCSISAFGDEPQASDLAGYDLLVQAVGGLMSITGTEESGPAKVGVALVDVLAALHGAVGVLAALRHREATGQGQRVDVTMLQSLLASMVNQSSAYLGTGVSPGRIGNRHPSIAPYQTLRSKDGSIALACGNDKQFRSLARSLQLSTLADDLRFHTNADRVAHCDELIEILESRCATIPKTDLLALLRDAGVPAGPVNSIGDAFEMAEQLGLDPTRMLSVGDRSIPQVTNPIRLSVTPVRYRLPPPVLPARGPARD